MQVRRDFHGQLAERPLDVDGRHGLNSRSSTLCRRRNDVERHAGRDGQRRGADLGRTWGARAEGTRGSGALQGGEQERRDGFGGVQRGGNALGAAPAGGSEHGEVRVEVAWGEFSGVAVSTSRVRRGGLVSGERQHWNVTGGAASPPHLSNVLASGVFNRLVRYCICKTACIEG